MSKPPVKPGRSAGDGETRTCHCGRAFAVGPRQHRKLCCSPACAKLRDRNLRREREGYALGRSCAECERWSCPLGHEWANVCSAGCRRARELRRQRDWRREEAADPGRRAAVNAARRERRRNDPERQRAKDRERYARRMADPAWVARHREQRRLYWRRTTKARLAKRAAWLAALSPERFARLMERVRERNRKYRSTRMATDPQYRAKQLQFAREAKRRARADRARAELAAAAAAIGQRMGEP